MVLVVLLCSLIWTAIAFVTPLIGLTSNSPVATAILSVGISILYCCYRSRVGAKPPADSHDWVTPLVEYCKYPLLGFYLSCTVIFGAFYALPNLMPFFQVSGLGIFLAAIPLWLSTLAAEFINVSIIVKARGMHPNSR